MEQKIFALIDTLESFAPHAAVSNATVSSANVGWHLGHSLMSIRGILRILEKSEPANFDPKWSLARWYIMSFGKIPRGRGRAPERSTPAETMTEQSVHALAASVRQNVNTIASLSKTSYFDHPYFGHLATRDAVKFVGIHTRHHMAIIRDILAAEKIKV